jgi:hypothetical protein
MTAVQWLLFAPIIVGFFMCCCGGCSKCDGDDADEYEVVLSLMHNNIFVDCADCADMNGTYILSRDNDAGWCTEDNCCYSYYFTPGGPCTDEPYRLRMQIRTTDIVIDFESDPLGSNYWRHQFTGAKSTTCDFASVSCINTANFGTPQCLAGTISLSTVP